MNNKFRNYIICFLSFIIPALGTFIAFYSNGIYPGSPTTLLTYDLRAEFIAYYGYFFHGGPGYDNLFHSMTGGLGGAYYGTFLLYVSPFDVIYSFIPLKYLPDAVYFMTLLRIGFSGFFCCLYILKQKKVKINAVWCVVLSCCYALMAYNIMYFVAPMWYDSVILLPLLALCLEKIISGNKSLLFIIFLSFCIFSNYYTAYMNVIALIMYFIFRLAEENYCFKLAKKRFIDFAIHGMLSAGLSAFVIIPAVIDLARGKGMEGDLSKAESFIKNTPVDVMRSLLPQSYAGYEYDASPSVFCGSIILILVIISIVFGKNKKAKIGSICILFIYFLSFVFGSLDRVWHGFRDPVCLCVRYGYTFCFFMICFAIRGIAVFENKKVNISKYIGLLIKTIIAVFSVAEMIMNSGFLISCIGEDCYYSTRDEYEYYVDCYKSLLSDIDCEKYGRLVSELRLSGYDGALFGYDGIDKFCSSYNYNISDFFNSVGLVSAFQTLESTGITPPICDLMCVRYEIKNNTNEYNALLPITNYGENYIYENVNALPLAFEISNIMNDDVGFVEDPFENINIIYSELFGYENTYDNKIFKAS